MVKNYIYLVITFGLFFSSCIQQDGLIKEIVCDLEDVSFNNSKFKTNMGGIKLSGAKYISTATARSGDNSLQLSNDNPYGLAIELKGANPDNYFFVSVWRKGGEKSCIVASDPEMKYFYEAESKVVETDSAGWELINLEFYIPHVYTDGIVKIYVWSNGDQEVYFDDFSIVQRKSKKFVSTSEEVLEILISDEALARIEAKRLEAYNRGVLFSEDDDYVSSKIIYKEDTLKGKIRLKGDWLDHLEGKKWSFRIKLKKKYSWKGMRTFSIHTPKSRYYLYEWFTHKIFEKEDVLTTRYGFVDVKLNGELLGVYAYEEHMEKNLLESKNRREGPILKFNEDPIWYLREKGYAYANEDDYPYIEASVIEPFKASKTFSSTTLSKQFAIANELMCQYKYGLKTSSDIFDVDKLAVYFALNDLTRTRHSLPYHNQRFYYNPITSKLEPIAFDCYHEKGVLDYHNWPIQGDVPEGEKFHLSSWMVLKLFQDEAFINKYLMALEKFSDENYILDLLEQFGDDLNEYEKMLKMEFPSFDFDEELYIASAKSIRENMDKYLKRLVFYNQILPLEKQESNYNTKPYSALHQYFVQCYTQEKVATENKVEVVNYTSLQLLALGEADATGILKPFEKEILIEPINQSLVNVEKSSEFVLCKFENTESIFSVPIKGWANPKGDEIPRQEIVSNYNVLMNKPLGIKIYNNEIRFISGSVKLQNPIYIPSGYNVFIDAGTTIDLVNHSMIISESPIYALGLERSPVKIYTSDGTGMGLSVFGAENLSVCKHVIFDQMRALNIDGWELTGAINFYESDVKLINVKFINNRSEDALNIIRSNFIVDNCVFDNIFSDAFDSDFSNGTLSNSLFRDIGNDAIDFSGSEVEIGNCVVQNALDKGISGGENSKLKISNCDIQDCNLGIASKDLSNLKVDNCNIANCNYGVTAFQKKPEYGGAEMILDNVKIENIYTRAFCVEEHSSIMNDTMLITGVEKNVSKLFY